MTTPDAQRKLTAILTADVAGCLRLVQRSSWNVDGLRKAGLE